METEKISSGFTEKELVIAEKANFCCQSCHASADEFCSHAEFVEGEEDGQKYSVFLCGDCYRNEYEAECPICEETYDDPAKPEEHFLIAGKGNEYFAPGLYQGVQYPLFAFSALGHEKIFPENLKLIAPAKSKTLPGCELDFTGQICPDCAKKYKALPDAKTN